MSKRNPYMTKDFWVKRQKNFQESDIYSKKGNEMMKESIDRIVNSFYYKEDFINDKNK